MPSHDVSTQPLDKPISTAATAPVADARDGRGRFVTGKSGNPSGVSKDLLPRRKQQIVALKENLEYAVRGPAGPLSADRVCRIVRKMCDMALMGDVKAARLVLGLALSSANQGDDGKDRSPPTLQIVVENATFQAVKQTAQQQPPIDGEFTEATHG